MNDLEILDQGSGVHALDAGYHRPLHVAIHLLVDSGEVAIVDTGTAVSVPRTLQALRQLGLAPEAVRYVLLTHVHLDHAGGAGLLMQHCPQASLVVHPRGARHMIDPRKLWQASGEVYGADHVRKVYGDPVPVPVARVIEAAHESVLALGSRRLRFLDTPGHARHHVAIVDSGSHGVFTGDVFGLSYRALDQDGSRPFLIPTSSPAQFEPLEAHRSIDLILAQRPQAVFLTHFSRIGEPEQVAPGVHRLLDDYVAVAEECRGLGEDRLQRLREGMRRVVLAAARRAGLRHPDAQILDVLDLDIELNAQGLVSWLERE